MNFNDVISVLMKMCTVAPWLKSVLMLGMNKRVCASIVDILAKLGCDVEDEDSVKNLFENEVLRNRFQEELAQLEAMYHRNMLRDLQGARERDLELRRARGRNLRANIMFAIAVVGIVSSVVILLCYSHKLTVDMIGIISAVATIFGVCLTNVYDFEFGRSGKHEQIYHHDMSRHGRRHEGGKRNNRGRFYDD